MGKNDLPETPSTARLSKAATIVVVAIPVVMLLVSSHLNFLRWQRDKIETVTVTPIPTPAATAQPSP